MLIVFGTRPEAIKMAPVVKDFRKHQEDWFETVVCVTGQHRELLDQMLNVFDIVPDIDLNIMQYDQDLSEITSRILMSMRGVLKEVKPNIVLVHGDTTTSSATALAAFYQQIPVAHIEAGLRTHNINSPWPEELNRQITGRIATWHFAPTALNRQNLLDEGIPDYKIFITGNTVVDALKIALQKVENNPNIIQKIENELIQYGLPLNLIKTWNGNQGSRMILITGHRRENLGEGLDNICKAIRDLANEREDVDFVYPVHLNPNVRNQVQKILGDSLIDNEIKQPSLVNHNIFLINPVQYLPFIYLMQKSAIIITDSGGIQEEAPGLGKPVLVMRSKTERPEGIKSGTMRLTGTNKDRIISEINRLLLNQEYYLKMSSAINPYGDGNAAERIVSEFLRQT